MKPGTQGGLAAGSGSVNGNVNGLPCQMKEQPGWSSNTDDSGYEAGYETDADESELSEWEGGNSRQGHKRKLDALVHLTMQLGFSERGEEDPEEESPLGETPQLPPLKTHRALGTQPVGLRLPLPHAISTTPAAPNGCSVSATLGTFSRTSTNSGFSGLAMTMRAT